MPYALLSDEFHSHPKSTKAGLDGCGLYARALSYCGAYLTDGFVPLSWTREIAKPATRNRVTQAGFWTEVKGGEVYEYAADGDAYTVEIPGPGFFIGDYLEYNPTRSAVLAKRDELSKKRSEAGKKGAQVRWQRQRQTDSNSDGKPVANAWQADSKRMAPLPLTPNPQPIARDPFALELPDLQAPSSYEGEEGHETKLWTRLLTACGGGTTTATKLERTIRTHHCTERDVICAIEAATGPGVQDPIAVALAELVKRAAERSAA